MAQEHDEMSIPVRMQILGDSDVGKTSFLWSYFKNQLYDGSPTFGYEPHSKIINYNIDEHSFNIEQILWDSAGLTLNRRLTDSHYNCCYACIFLYDVTNKKSFDNQYTWISEYKMRTKGTDKAVMWLVGNKLDEADMSENSRQVSQKEAKELCDAEGLGGYTEVSAHYNNLKINKIFDMLIKEVVAKNYQELVDNFKRENLENLEENKSSCNQF